MRFTDGLWRDAAFAMRLFRRVPLFTATAVMTLALGVGVNTAIFSVVNAFIFRPLPVRDSDRLMVVATRRAPVPSLSGVSYKDLQDYRAATTSEVFEDIAGYSVGFLGLADEGRRPERVLTTWVTDNYFQTLDLRPAVGRLIEYSDRSAAVVVLGHSTWLRRFGGSPAVVGRIAAVNGRPRTVIGVAPPGFAGTFAFSESEIYLPLNSEGGDPESSRDARSLHAFGRLQPGVAIGRAQASLDVVATRLAREHPGTNGGVSAVVVPERVARPEEDQARSSTRIAATLLALVGLVLLVAVSNVTSLLLARAAGRSRELAIRAAIGAGRVRLIRQLGVESLLLSMFGGAVGIVLAAWACFLLAGVRLPGDLPVRFDFDLDRRVLGFALLLTSVTGLAVGIVPALRSSRVDPDRELRRGAGSAPERARLRRLLMIGEIAICFVLLSAALLFVRSLRHAERIDPGFRPDSVLNVQMDVGQLDYDDARGRAFFDEIETRIAALPGVDAVSFAFVVPMGYISIRDRVAAEGSDVAPGDRLVAGKNIVGPGYFDTMGIGIVRGRPFGAGDSSGARPVAIVNERMADALWSDGDPIGRRFRTSEGGPWTEVVGVARTGKYRSLFEDPAPYFYVPIGQDYVGLRVLHIRTSGRPEALISTVERIIHQREPDLPLYDVQSMRAALGGGYGLFLVRAGAIGAGLTALLGLGLATVGVFGVVSYLVGQRTREIGVRRALGATGSDIVGLLMREGCLLVTSGLIAGLSLSLAVSWLFDALLVGVAAGDPFTFAAVAGILGAVALAACAVPAWRASSVDPAVTLRAE